MRTGPLTAVAIATAMSIAATSERGLAATDMAIPNYGLMMSDLGFPDRLDGYGLNNWNAEPTAGEYRNFLVRLTIRYQAARGAGLVTARIWTPADPADRGPGTAKAEQLYTRTAEGLRTFIQRPEVTIRQCNIEARRYSCDYDFRVAGSGNQHVHRDGFLYGGALVTVQGGERGPSRDALMQAAQQAVDRLSGGGADDPYGLSAFLGAGERIQRLPLNFLRRALGHFEVEFRDPSGGAGAEYWPSDNLLTVKRRLGKDGKLLAFDDILVEDRASIYHEWFHGYVDWAGDTGADGFVKAFIDATKCRYATISPELPGDRVTWQLDADTQEEIWEEAAGVFIGRFVTEWPNVVFFISGGAPDSLDWDRDGPKVRDEMLKRVREWADDRTVKGYFKCGGGWPVSGCPNFHPSLVSVSAENAMSAHEMRFILRNLMGFSEEEVARHIPPTSPPTCPRVQPGPPAPGAGAALPPPTRPAPSVPTPTVVMPTTPGQPGPTAMPPTPPPVAPPAPTPSAPGAWQPIN